jgi:hypothetical protein
MFSRKKIKITARGIFPVLLALICIALPLISLAQGPPDTEDVPIDGGLSFLLAAGTAYGIKKYRNYKTSAKSVQK